MPQEKLKDIALDIPEIENRAKDYVHRRDDRMEYAKLEGDAQAHLVAAMKDAGVESYRTVDGMECRLDPGKEKVKVSRPKDEKG